MFTIVSTIECNTAQIKYSLSAMQILGDSYVSYLEERPRLREDFVVRPIVAHVVKNSFVLVNIFYGSLSYMVSTESAQMDLIGLLGAIGGNMCLFLGVSLFTFGEMLTLCVELWFMWKKEKTKNAQIDGFYI